MHSLQKSLTVSWSICHNFKFSENEAAAATVAEGAGDGRLEGGAAVAVAALSYHGLSLASSALPPRRSHVRYVPNVLHLPRSLH